MKMPFAKSAENSARIKSATISFAWIVTRAKARAVRNRKSAGPTTEVEIQVGAVNKLDLISTAFFF
jgi:hypothetical protein